ncbi:sodium:solute symporter family protein [Aquimarina megaterium]|uniref:sodium:solute symporter family protein n=1 Tax=Aquimarina megaterium TaxID=1443666 RepID=UPI000943A6AC|nr:sodium:solute symporter family protein [Aquimarina megaterium]
MNNQQIITAIFVGITFLIYSIIAIRNKAKNTHDFYVAGGNVHPIANAMATAADWMSAATFISLPGIVSFMGYDGSVYLLGGSGGFVLLAMLIAPYLRKFGKFTIPDFIGDRYYSDSARIAAIICTVFITFTYLAGQMRGVGVVFSRFLEVEINTGVVIGAIIVFIYAVLGGMKGITYTQVAQYCILIFAFMVPVIFLSIQLTNNPLPFFGLGSKVAGSEVFLLDKLDGLNTELGFEKFTDRTMSMTNLFAMAVTLMIGTAGMPHVIVRFFTVPKVKDARKSVGYALFFIVILFISIPAVGAFTRTIFIENLQGIAYSEVPSWFKTWENIGLISFNDLNMDGIIHYAKNTMVNELTVDKDIIFLMTPEVANLPNWVVALVAAGGLAAALSTAAGLILVLSTSISRDLYKNLIDKKASDKRELIVARFASMFAILVGIYFGMNPPGFVMETISLAFGIAASALFPVIFMGIFSKKMNKQGAISAMIVGLVFSVSYIVYFKFLGGSPENYWFKISPQGIGLLGIPLSFVTMFILSKFFDSAPEEVQQAVDRIRLP